MSFGNLNTFIDIISAEHVKDADGFVQTKDTILASVRAYKEDRHANQTWANRAAFSTATALFRFRRIPGLAVVPSLYVTCAGERYRILSAEDVKGRGMYSEVLAEKITPTSR